MMHSDYHIFRRISFQKQVLLLLRLRFVGYSIDLRFHALDTGVRTE